MTPKDAILDARAQAEVARQAALGHGVKSEREINAARDEVD